jgi:hypothetical protein
MFLWKPVFDICRCSITPDNFIPKIVFTKDFILDENFYFRIRVPVAMQKNTSCGFEYAVHFLDTFFEPVNVMAYAARPPVLKTADFTRVAPDYLVIAVAEKRRVKVNQVYGVVFHRLEYFEVVAEYKAVYGHGLYLPQIKAKINLTTNREKKFTTNHTNNGKI